ncbi:hypothetical protein ACLWBD_09085 [Bdellovibrio sp. HCB117]|uniref:hypothetical protein n=1 Tax=Bdellovibrio sp. HCB117 TaxID=3394359 RepID=UPI0039B6851E
MAFSLHNKEEIEVYMKDAKFLIITLLAVAAMSLSACAKKDSEFAARYQRNKMGATVVDGAKTQAAGEQAAAQGLEADVVNVTRHWTPEGQPGPRVVISTILVNNQEVPVTTVHSGTEQVNGRVDIAGYVVAFHAMCGNATCNPYYATMEVYQNNRMIIQEGVRVFFDKQTPADEDRYQWFKPEESLPLVGAGGVSDPTGMVGYFNTTQAVIGSGRIK